ncbi:GGDEF domain-containing protein [Jeotgalibacillus salarius]|uniref:Sensor domain-containing diguanylate cyclase n=1 Tax=Jeotgalibacillus salarius TaxID=546023 RepID=A0A4Y8LH33_9BACL|nr:sensor domain-containing diguanylate cyclase [Jeotgalibacillus salarius]TFE01663.1 sensor domain-containing diguanylate cyclase [Jeotgalibacillus salarius]
MEALLLSASYIFVAFIANTLRFYVNGYINRLIFVMSTVLLVLFEQWFAATSHTSWLLLFVIAASVVSFHFSGGMIAAALASLYLWGMTGMLELSIYAAYFLFAGSIYAVRYYVRKIRQQRDHWLEILTINSKQLNVTKDVSQAMQQTFNTKRLLETILTSMTAGHGLGYNRAMIFLLEEDRTKLKGIMATGPVRAEEGFEIWENITVNRYGLADLINKKEEEKSDQQLNEIVQNMEIPLEQQSFLKNVMESGSPILVKKINEDDELMKHFHSTLNLKEFAVIPMLHQGVKSGVVMIDNVVNQKPLSMHDVDIITPLATQAAIALQQASQYETIERMALKDGLTNLYNQRAFQQSLSEEFCKRAFSIILLDIDFFKNYNDTNGHMLGNEVLVQLAAVITNSLRGDDLAYRFGGEEFVILLPNTEKDKALMVAERIRRRVEETEFPKGELQPGGKLTISLGVSESDGSLDPFDAVEYADQALYEAKENGKNCVAVKQGA